MTILLVRVQSEFPSAELYKIAWTWNNAELKSSITDLRGIRIHNRCKPHSVLLELSRDEHPCF